MSGAPPDLLGRLGDFFAFLGENSAASGWLGLVVSISGFTLTYWQIRRTRRATEAATMAAGRTVQSLRRQQRLVAVSRLQAVIRSVDAAVQANQPGSIWFLLNDWRDEAMRVAGLSQTEGEAGPDISDLVASIDAASAAIAAVTADPTNVGQATAEVRQIMNRAIVPLAMWGAGAIATTEAFER